MIETILIVDDHASLLEGLSKAIVKYCDYRGEIKTVSDGEHALAEIGSRFYDICFLDLNLPDISGIEVMDAIHRISPKTRVVIMTAEYIDNGMRERIGNNASLIISKPIELDDIRDYITKKSKLSADRGKKEHDGNSNINIHEKRKSARNPYKIRVDCSLSVFYNWELKSDMQADIIDLSQDGVGISVNYPVYPGNVLRFDKAMENKTGLVKWSRKENESYRAGVRFI